MPREPRVDLCDQFHRQLHALAVGFRRVQRAVAEVFIHVPHAIAAGRAGHAGQLRIAISQPTAGSQRVATSSLRLRDSTTRLRRASRILSCCPRSGVVRSVVAWCERSRRIGESKEFLEDKPRRLIPAISSQDRGRRCATGGAGVDGGWGVPATDFAQFVGKCDESTQGIAALNANESERGHYAASTSERVGR